MGTLFKIDNYAAWDYVDPSDNDDNADSVVHDNSNDDFDCIVGAFQASILCSRIILDEIHIPADGCAAIAKAI